MILKKKKKKNFSILKTFSILYSWQYSFVLEHWSETQGLFMEAT